MAGGIDAANALKPPAFFVRRYHSRVSIHAHMERKRNMANGKTVVERTESGAVVITGTDIDKYRMLVLRSALKLEAVGLRRRGRSVTSIVRTEFGIKARRTTSVLREFEDMLRAAGVLAERTAK